jgi:hypothetical protein
MDSITVGGVTYTNGDHVQVSLDGGMWTGYVDEVNHDPDTATYRLVVNREDLPDKLVCDTRNMIQVCISKPVLGCECETCDQGWTNEELIKATADMQHALR